MKLKCPECGYDKKILSIIMDDPDDVEDRFLECPDCGEFIGYTDKFDLEVIDNIERVYSTRYDCRAVPEGVRLSA